MRRYDDPVEVRLAPQAAGTRQSIPGQSTPGQSVPGQSVPGQFVWRGRLYVVGAVLAHWVEVGAWWRIRDAEGLPVAAHATGRQVWRVEARAGRSSTDGIYDLSHDLSHDLATWSLARALD